MLTLLFIINHMLNVEFHKRCDGMPVFPYYKSEDLGLKEERFFFPSGKWMLTGSRYYVGKGPYKAVLVFFHGIGAGRESYLKEISVFAKEGYLVYSFDYTGSMQSEGPYIYSLGHVGKDVRAFYSFLDSDSKAKGYKRYSCGHSWGGYSAMLSMDPKYKVEKTVSISGFVRPSNEYIALTKNFNLKPLRWLIQIDLWLRDGKDGDRNVIDVIRKSHSSLLYIQGNKDTMVPPETSGLILKKALENRPNTSFYEVEGRGHVPFISKEADKHQSDCVKQGLTKLNHPVGLHMDVEKATEENPEVMERIIDFFAL